MSYAYRSHDALKRLGERIRDKAIKVTLDQADEYAAAQQRANNYPAQSLQPNGEKLDGYTPPNTETVDDADLRKFVAADYAEIPQLFTAFAIPDPAAIGRVVQTLYESAAALAPSLEITLSGGKLYYPMLTGETRLTTPVADVVNQMTNHMRDWKGQGAQAFDDYLASFTESATLQCQFAASLAITLRIQQEIRERMLTDVWQIGQETLKLLGALHPTCPGGALSTTSVVLTVAVAALSVAAAIPSGGLSFGLAAAGFAGTLTGADASAPKAPLGGGTVMAVIGTMQAALHQVTASVDDQQVVVAKALRALDSVVVSNWSTIELPPPAALYSLGAAGAGDLDGRHLFTD